MTGEWESERGEFRRKCGECVCEDLMPRPLHSTFVHLHFAKLCHLCVKRQIRHFSSLHRSLSAETLHPLASPHSAHTEVYRCVYTATKTIPTSVQGELLYMCLKIEIDTYQRMCGHSGSEKEDISVHSNQISVISRCISNTHHLPHCRRAAPDWNRSGHLSHSNRTHHLRYSRIHWGKNRGVNLWMCLLPILQVS